MLLKIKDHCGKLRGEAGMLLITKDIRDITGNVIETKGLNDAPAS
jgi:hypothetical protein